MDLSGLIFVALAVAWAAYLIPKALRHHDDVVRGRSVDRFSQSMRVLARREPVTTRTATLVVPGRPVGRAASAPAPAGGSARAAVAERRGPDVPLRASTARAARRRRRVLGLLLLALLACVVTCALRRAPWAVTAAPGALLVAWLVACRLMVRHERRRGARRPLAAATIEEEPDVAEDADAASVEDGPAGPGEPRRPERTGGSQATEPELWDPVPVTLPTYVSKPPARRTVRTIDLDSTGVWTSGRTQADTALAREADAAEAAERVRRRVSRKGEPGGEAVGS